MQTQSYDLEGLEQANEVLTRSNSALMAQLAHMIVTINGMHAQFKTLASAQKKARPKRKHYC